MEKLLKRLLDKKFLVYVSDEYERTTDFLGLMKLLANYSDFFRESRIQQYRWLKGRVGLNQIFIRVDSNIIVYYKI